MDEIETPEEEVEVEEDEVVAAADGVVVGAAAFVEIVALNSCILLTGFKPKESMTNNNGLLWATTTKLNAQQDIER